MKTETLRVIKFVLAGLVLMFLVFFVLHVIIPAKVPFDYRVISAGVIGGAVAVLNFFLLGLSVQKLADIPDKETGKNYFKASYRRRFLIQILWGVIAIVAPVFNAVAGLLPLLIPSTAIKLKGIIDGSLSDSNKKERR